MKAQTILIERIKTAGLQTRAALNSDTVQEYVEAETQQGAVLPPVICFDDGRDLWLADGFHRLEAARHIGKGKIRAEVRDGSKADALRFALGANAGHGLRRTNADKARAIKIAWDSRRMLGLPASPSAGVIAELVGVTTQTVINHLKDVAGFAKAPERVGRDGVARTLPPPPVKRATTPTERILPPMPIEHKEAPPTPPVRPQKMIGGDGAEIPPELVEIWNRRGEIIAAANTVGHVRSMVNQGENDDLWLGINRSAVLAGLDRIYAEIKAAVPWATCPMCQGTGCKACVGRGLISEKRYREVVPEELKG